MNPVRAGMVESATDYCWSSYHHNALGEADALITEHALYNDLAREPEQRYRCYQDLFDRSVNKGEDRRIAEATLKGEVFGSELFHKKIGKLLERVTHLGAHGGDRKSKSFQDQAG